MQNQIQDDSDSEYRTEIITKTQDNQEITVKQTIKESKVRSGVIERLKWEKWGEVSGLPRGQHRDGDTLEEAELRIQPANNYEELNFVIAPPKTLFVVNFNEQQAKPQQQQQARQVGEKITFDQAPAFSSQWLVIVSNLVQFEFAETFTDIIKCKDDFRRWLKDKLGQEENRQNYFINFLQNKRKQKILSYDGLNSHQPLIQKVMLKFPDKNKAEIALNKLTGQSYDGCILSLELQEQRPR